MTEGHYECYISLVWHFMYVVHKTSSSGIVWSNLSWFATETWFPVGWQK